MEMELYHYLFILGGALVGIVVGICFGIAIYKSKHKEAVEKIEEVYSK